jgi:hypothetical protein
MTKRKSIFLSPFRIGTAISILIAYGGFWVNGFTMTQKFFIGGAVAFCITTITTIDWNDENKKAELLESRIGG